MINKLLQIGVVCLLVTQAEILTAANQPLPRSSPAKEGVSSAGILQFLEDAKTNVHEFHSIMILRHGNVIAEGWWKPYAPGLKHTLYSVSKSFTSSAVGIAVDEGKLKVSDRVLSFFPEHKSLETNKHLAELTVGDLLSMSAGQDPDPTGKVSASDDWVKAFLQTPIIHKPGTKFLYNSVASHMLSAIVKKATGKNVADYLTENLFNPLGISGIDWETDPNEINTGGWGLRLKTEDLAKFGQLMLQGGVWKGKQLLSREWVAAASSAQIMQAPDATSEQKEKNDWLHGYGYQFWVSRNGFRADGAYGQYIIALPKQDAVIAITSETKDMQGILNMVWKHLLPAFSNSSISSDAALKKALRNLQLPTPPRSDNQQISLKKQKFNFPENRKNLKSITFVQTSNNLRVNLEDYQGSHAIQFGHGNWIQGETKRPGPYLVANAKNVLRGLPPFKVAGAFTWPSGNVLELSLRYVESPHMETWRFEFKDDQLTMELKNSLDPKRPVQLTGQSSN